MVKSKKIRRETKRLMYLFSYDKFKRRLETKNRYYPDVVVRTVTEEYTSKTCTRCGEITDVKGAEIYKCSHCPMVINRDHSGARNIFIKTFIRK